MVNRFDVYLVNLDANLSKDAKNTRPCVVISPDEMNRHINTVIVAPLTTKGKLYPTRVGCKLQGKQGMVVLDQIRTVDKTRLIHKIGRLDTKTQAEVLRVLGEIFAP